MPDEKRYCGQFIDDNYHGFGVLTNLKATGHDVVKYQGYWQNGKQDDKGMISTTVDKNQMSFFIHIYIKCVGGVYGLNDQT